MVINVFKKKLKCRKKYVKIVMMLKNRKKLFIYWDQMDNAVGKGVDDGKYRV